MANSPRFDRPLTLAGQLYRVVVPRHRDERVPRRDDSVHRRSGFVIVVRNDDLAAAPELAETLRYVADLPLARLCFSPGGGDQLAPDDRLTILQIQGLSFPEAAGRMGILPRCR